MNRATRFEDVTLYVILLLIGGTAAAASFTHVHDVTVAHGQPDWIGWANATVLELISIAVGLEIRRRRRHNIPVGAFTVTVLAVAVVLSLAAQVAEAERSVWGWIVAALPAAAFLALVKIVLSRPVIVPEPAPTNLAEPARVPVEQTDPAAVVPHQDEPSQDARDLAPPIPNELITAAVRVADQHQQHTGRPITRDTLRSELRVSNATAGDLLRALRDQPSGTVPAVPARMNGRANPS